MTNTERIFTLSEARRALPEIAAVVAVMRRRMQRLEQLEVIRSAMRRSTASDGAAAVNEDDGLSAELSKLRRQLNLLLKHLAEQGVEVKDPLRGLIDWRARREGRTVYLCWQPGERTIEWWHELDAGFAGRQRIVASEWAA